MARISLPIIVAAGSLASSTVMAADMALKAPVASPNCEPYVNYNCLDNYLGDDFATRLYRYYALEWGHDAPPSDPKAPPSRRSDAVWPVTPQSTPPMPFTEWPYGGAPSIGVTRQNSVDSPLMVALGNTLLGQAMNAAHIQMYGWVNPGGNISTNTVKPGGNFPVCGTTTRPTLCNSTRRFSISNAYTTLCRTIISIGVSALSGIYGRRLSLHHGIRSD